LCGVGADVRGWYNLKRGEQKKIEKKKVVGEMRIPDVEA
jgi:hypothetical protein